MTRVRRARPTAVVASLALACALGTAGCANTSLVLHHDHRRAVGQDGPAAPAAQVAVVRRWATALQHGHVRAAAELFHLPSLFIDGQPVTIRTLAQAEAVNDELPCGATYVSAFRQGRLIDVLFRLTDRSGRPHGCGTGVGLTARTAFLIRDGQIVEWLRAPSLPGDPGTGSGPPKPGHGSNRSTSTTSTTQTSPGATTTGGSPIRELLSAPASTQKPS